MVRLYTEQGHEAIPVNVETPASINPPVHNFNSLTQVIGDTIETRGERRNLGSLAGFAVDLLDLSAIDQELKDSGFGGLTEEETEALTSAGTDAAKFRALQQQRSRTRSGMLKRAARARQFIAENPLLVEEALTIYKGAVGRAPGETIRELEQDPLADDIAEANPIAQYQQGILDDAEKWGVDITRPISQIEKVVSEKRQILARAEIEKAKWEALDSVKKQDEVLTLENFMASIFPQYVTAATNGLDTLEIPTGTQERTDLIQALNADFARQKLVYDQHVGIYGTSNPAYVQAFAMLAELKDLKIQEISGDIPRDIEQSFRDRQQYIVDNLTNFAREDFLRRVMISANGEPITGADFEQSWKLLEGIDLTSLIKMDIAGVPFESQLAQIVAMAGTDVDMAAEVIYRTSATQAATAFNAAIGNVRGAARGQPGFNTQVALNTMNSYFNNFSDIRNIPESVQKEVLSALGDREVAEFLHTNQYDFLGAVNEPLSNYVERSMQVINEDLEDFNVSIGVTEVSPGVFSVSFKKGSGRFNGSPQDITSVRQAHKARVEAMIRARLLWLGGTAEDALQMILEQDKQFLKRAPVEEDSQDINITVK